MTSCVSDSEDEEPILIKDSMISIHKFVNLLLQSNERLQILANYKHLFNEDQWNKLNDLSIVDVNQVLEDKTLAKNVSPISNRKSRKIINDLDLTGSILHLDPVESSRRGRGLRRRTFAATHPYLVDSIKYLGLASINYLNDLFMETPDLNGILKILNNSYLKLKKKYPKDEKYQKRDFYTVYGETKKLAEDQINQDVPYKPIQSSQIDSQIIDSSNNSQIDSRDINSDYENINQLISPKKSDFTDIDDNQLDEESSNFTTDDDDSINENLIRVGGKYIKEQNLLRGALPESAKRLNFYKNASKQHFRKTTNKIGEIRKGLARKKINTSSRKPRETFIDLIDDNPQIEDGNHSIDDSRLSLDIFDVLSEASETENTDDEVFTKDIKISQLPSSLISSPKKEDDSRFYLSDYSDFEGYESFFELDMINPLLNRRKLHNSEKRSVANKKRKSRVLGAQNPISSSTKRSRTFGNPVNLNKTSNSSHPKSSNQLKVKRQSFQRSLYHTKSKSLKFGKLKTKQIVKPPSIKATLRKSEAQEPNLDSEILAHNKNLLTSKFEFLRDPYQSTLQFEVEDKEYKRAKQPCNIKSFVASKLSSNFPKDFILTIIDIEELQKLKDGKSYIPTGDSVSITLLGNFFVLTTLDVFKSESEAAKAFSLIQKILKDKSKLRIDSIASEIYYAISGLLQWNLILQRKPSELIWRLTVETLSFLSTADCVSLGERHLNFYPLFILLNYVLILLEEINHTLERRIVTLRSAYFRSCEAYWPLFFSYFKLEEIETIVWEKTHRSESFHIMYKLLSLDNKLWLLINNSLSLISKDSSLLLEDVLSLVTFIPPKSYNWSCFYTIYQNISEQEDSLVYNRFLDAIELLHQRFSWPIDERMILLLYETITSRRFGNFLDEWVEPDLIGKIRSRDDLPDCSFFERFMKLLYGYISAKETYDKRLITKLFTSSKYKFEPNREHFIMFVNRMNFILFLFQCSKEDLNNQMTSLIESVQGLNDFNILALSVESLLIYTELANEKNFKPPLESFILIIQELTYSYLRIPKIKIIWNNLLLALEVLAHTCQAGLFKIFVELGDMPDKFALGIFKLLALDLEKLTFLDLKLVNTLELKFQNLLNIQMGRCTIESLQNSSLQERIIMILFELWLKFFSLSSNPNWDKLVLQIFPYIGNQILREKFNLYFYFVLLNYTNLNQWKDIIFNAVLRDLVSISSSKYLAMLMLQLNENDGDILKFSKDDLKCLTTTNSLGAKKKIVLMMIRNISNSQIINNVTKDIYLEEIVKALNLQFDLNHGNKWYREFCRLIILEVQKVCNLIMKNKEALHSLANKLGILQEELDQFEWIRKPIPQKLADVHLEFSHALIFNGDHHQALSKLIFSETELIFHLISLYLLDIILNHNDKWKHLHYILQFYYMKLRAFQFRTEGPEFLKFLKMLSEVPWLLTGKCSELEHTYRLQVNATILDLFIYCHVLFDGFKDKAIVVQYSRDLVQAFSSSKSKGISGTVRSLFSTFEPFEIIHNKFETNLNVQELTDVDSAQRASTTVDMKIECLEKLNFEYLELTGIPNEESSICLSFDMN